jgi:putative heme-binding domain-containing protein
MKKLRFSTALLFLLASSPFSASAAPEWIWLSKSAEEGQKVTFRKSFDAPKDTASATLSLTCDNGADVMINGKKALSNPDWSEPSKADVKKLLRPGSNEIIVNASNQGSVAALVAVLELKTRSGKTVTIETGSDWEAATTGKTDFKPSTVVANYGDQPWGKALDGASATASGEIVLLPGFEAELLYNVPKATQGSWVSMTVGPEGKLIVCDQYGGLYRVTVPAIGTQGEALVEPLKTPIEGGAHGLLYAFDSLYVMVNEKANKGLWRLRDTNGNGEFDKAEHLRKINGGGEHGAHAIILSPDKKSLFIIGGNHTDLPENMEQSRGAKAWSEDHILPRMWDANGHARGKLAPGGWICKTDPDGKTVELYCSGFRNEYDIAFTPNGDLFTFDADMEWDMGTPWYRPTRLDHCVSGGEYGWRSGSGKWPDYYPDTLPPVADIGPGSPTGVVAGTGAKFPVKYQNAIYINDWTYGTMYAMHLIPDGASFKAVKEEFVSGRPLPLTDLVIHPKDGAMYFAVGGRRTQSALYRVTYTGKESTAPAQPAPLTAEAKLRRDIETLHENGTGPEAINKAWPYLSHKDRFVRFAARVAIERQPVDSWASKALESGEVEALIALARMGDKALQPRLIDALAKLDLSLPVLRAWQLCFTRMGKPAADVCAQIASKLNVAYPNSDSMMTRELCQLLIFLDDTSVVSKTLGIMASAKDDHEDIAAESLLSRNSGYASAAREVSASRPNKQQFYLIFALRNATAGWTPDLHRAYFNWFPVARTWKGGNSFKGFIENARKEALAIAPESERAVLDELSSKSLNAQVANYVAPKGPGASYTVDSVLALADGKLKVRNFKNGQNMFNSTMCLACHRFNGDGGSVGPDITGAGARYSLKDLLENIVEPSKVISDQYDSHLIEMKDGSAMAGRVIVEENGKTFIMTNPFAPSDLATVNTADVKGITPRGISMMPPGTINVLNQDELLDLLAYILAAGNPDDAMFK